MSLKDHKPNTNKHPKLFLGFHTKQNKAKNEINVSDLADIQNCDLFQNAAELGEVNVVKIIIYHSKTMDMAKDMPNQPLSPQALAIRNEYFNVFAMLIKADYTYPLFLDISNFSDEIKEYIKNGTNMHSAIKSSNKEEIEKILAKSPKQKHYYNLENESALKTAVVKKSYDIYKFLLNNGVEFGPHEELFDFLKTREKRKLTEFHFKHSKDLPDSHINILMMNTTVSHYDDNHNDKEQYIKKAYEVLNQIPSTKVILEAVAASKKFEIVFDFKRDSVHMVDLTVDQNTKGICVASGRICIGAKQLLDPSTEHETFGTLAHELCHYALHLTYNNVAKPYSDKDRKSLKDFEDISRICRNKQDGEDLIKMVYSNYEGNEIHAELAVRAPHLIAQYYNAPEKLENARAVYHDMFGYYENIVVPQMKEALPKIMKEAEKMSRDKIVFICFVISMVLLGLMGIVLYFWLYTPFYEYPELSPVDKTRVRNAVVRYKGVDVVLCNLYPNDTKIYQNLTSEHITQIFNNEKLDLSNPFFTYLTNSIFFSWTNLTKPLKLKFLNSTISFQNENVKLKDLNDLNPNAFKSLTSEQIISVLDGNVPLVIGNMKQMSAKFYMDRKFIPENSILAQIKYNNVKNKTELWFVKFYESYPKEKLTAEFKARRESYSTHVGNSVDRISEYNAVKSLMEYKSFHKSLNNVTKDAEDSRLFVLSAEAGAGKTVTFEHLAIKLKKMAPTKWVSYIDLKDYTEFYQDYLDAEKLLEKILNLTSENEFERKIFEDSYKSNNSILLWNGYDEVSPIYSNFTLKVIKDVQQNTKNIQYICTRPLYSNELNENLNVDPHMLVPFNSDEQAEFLHEYFMAKNATVMSDPNEMVSRVLNLTKKLTLDANKQYDTPLLLAMFAEVSTDSPNLYKIFDQFFAKKQKILEDKNLLGTLNLYKNPPNSNFNILQIYQQFAVKIDIFPFAFSTHPVIHRLHIFKKMNLNPSYYADISRTGILYIHDESKFEFAHKTFAEFFIAQYFIDNIYNVYGLLDEKEADARLELFFISIQYSLTFDKVIEFVRDYVKYDIEKNPFHEETKKVLKNKYKKHLIYILNKTYKDSFRFFFEFFKKDKELMLDLLKVNENETFYTALFNPFYSAAHLYPEDIKNTVKSYLTPDEFNSFINGQHQRGVLLFGMFDRNELDNLEVHNVPISNETSFWEFYDMIKPNLTSEELKQLFLNPIVTFIYRKHSSTYETNEKFWYEVESLFDKQDMNIFLGNLFPQIFRPKLEIPSDVDSNSLDMLINKTQNILSSKEISEMASKTHLLFKSARSFPQLQIVWDFIVKHTVIEERQKLLKYDFRLNPSTEDQQFYSMYYKFFVMTPMVLHVNMFSDNFTDSIDFVEKIYSETFEKSEIQGFFTESNNFLFPLIFTRPIEACQKVVALLERLFEGNDQKLVELIEKDFNDTKLTIFEYFDKMLAFAFKERENVRQRLKIFSDLRDKLRNRK